MALWDSDGIHKYICLRTLDARMKHTLDIRDLGIIAVLAAAQAPSKPFSSCPHPRLQII